MSRHVSALAVVLLFVTSGCLSGVQAPGQADAHSDVVQTVTDANHTDVEELYTAHFSTLENTSGYRVVGEYRDNGSLVGGTTVTVDNEDRRVLQRTRYVYDERRETATSYVNESGRYLRYPTNESGTHTYRFGRIPEQMAFERVALFEHPSLPPDLVLARFDFEFVGQRDGAYAFEADGLKPREEMTLPHWYWEVNDTTDASATLVVEESGLIRHLSTSVTVNNRGVVTTTGYEIHASRLDQTSVSKPPWVEEAVAADGRAANQSA